MAEGVAGGGFGEPGFGPAQIIGLCLGRDIAGVQQLFVGRKYFRGIPQRVHADTMARSWRDVQEEIAAYAEVFEDLRIRLKLWPER